MITDYWDNALSPVPVQVIGYRGSITTFPHDLYSFLLSTIREKDQQGTALIWRWLQPMQQFWESQYGLILDIPNLISPTLCPATVLEYLRKNVGIMDDLGYIWSCLEESDKRRLIKFFIRFLKYRSTGFGLDEMIETMTGLHASVQDYFYFRWLLSGDTVYEMATALGREDDGYDSWLISEPEMATGVIPDAVNAVLILGEPQYVFTLDSLVDALQDPPVPEKVYVKLIGAGIGQYMPLVYLSSHWVAVAELGFAFGQSESSMTVVPSNFRAGFESDEYVFDIMLETSDTLNKEMVRGLVQFSRPQSERVYIRYYNIIEEFVDFYRWTEESGTATWSETNRNVVLADVAADTRIQLTLADAVDWVSYCVHVKMQHGVNNKWSQIRFMVQDTNNYYYLELIPATPPTIPAGEWELHCVISGVDLLLADGDLEWLDDGVDYMWRIECVTSNRPSSLIVQVIRVYQDENLLIDYVDNPAPWDGTVKGTVEIVAETGGSLTVSRVLVHPIPMEYDFVGP